MFNQWANGRRGHFSKAREKPRVWVTGPAITTLPSALLPHPTTCPHVTPQTALVGFRHQSIIKSWKNRLRNICQHSAARWCLHVFRTSFQITIRSSWRKVGPFLCGVDTTSTPSLISIIPDPPFSLGLPLGSAHDCKGVANNHRGLRFLS